MSPKVSVIIVSYNSQKVLHKAMKALYKQTLLPHKVVIVDTGSEDREYLTPYNHVIFARKNGGFCLGNNVGYPIASKDADYVLLLNPDAFLFEDFIEKSVARMEGDASIGALTGRIYGYDIAKDVPTGRFDSTGIFQKFYGKWYDRGQGEKVTSQIYPEEEIPAICGAVFFGRKKAFDAVLEKGNLFKPDFYMYKEDIDLSLRLQKTGWRLLFAPELQAYHCRGWQKRSAIPRNFRLLSAKNECSINFARKKPLPILYSVLKWTVVKLLNI